MGKTALYQDIVKRLQSELKEYDIKEEAIEKIADEMEGNFHGYNLDTRWKDYFEVRVYPDNERTDIYISIGGRDLDFDGLGNKTGSGMMLIDMGKPPWEKEEKEEEVKKNE